MRINYAHLRERSTAGGWINFAVFEARSASGTSDANAEVLARLTMRARALGQQIDQSALAFNEHGRIRFFGDKNLVDYLSRSFSGHWTHWIED